jgi:hypothetical protein
MANAIQEANRLSDTERLKMLMLARQQIEKNHNTKKMIHTMLTLYNQAYESENS